MCRPHLDVRSLITAAMSRQDPEFLTSLLAGGAAGLAVDLALFPLDTIKTRLQSSQGFWKTGGFRGIYRGIASTALGSAPNAALFFVTYDTMKCSLSPLCPEDLQPVLHMMAASSGEVMACLVRVPVEVVKQRVQTVANSTSFSMLRNTISAEGVAGLYRGFFSTVMREVCKSITFKIPFSIIQYPIWEFLKKSWSVKQGYYVDSWQASLCGAVAGGISAGLTTPLDVAKTRIMLAKKGSEAAQGRILRVLQIVYHEKGFRGLYAGLTPRVTWISIGGAVFFGIYEKTKDILQRSNDGAL